MQTKMPAMTVRNTSLDTISPLDGRYKHMLTDLPTGESRIHHQMHIEYLWANHIARALGTPLVTKPFEITPELMQCYHAHETRIGHDVKAMELAVAETFFDEEDRRWVHFGLTSEDINSFGNGFMLTRLHKILRAEFNNVIATLSGLKDAVGDYRICARTHGQPARTHGQPAIPTDYNYRIGAYLIELIRLVNEIKTPNRIKFGGAVGNFDALSCIVGDRLMKIVDTFASGEFVREEMTFQTSFYNSMATYFHGVNTVLNFMTKIGWDLWDSYSRGHFVLGINGGRVGSSVMCQKINPANTENAMGAFDISIMWLTHLAQKLPQFRLERDISDSIHLRNLSEAFGYAILGCRNWRKDLNNFAPSEDLDNEIEISAHGEVYSARVQTFLRYKGVTDAYEIVRKATQGKTITDTDMFELMVPYFKPEWIPKLYSMMDMPMCLNTSNKGKQAEYQRMASLFGASFVFTDADLEEPNADHDTVVVYKATMADQFHSESVCEDSALYIGGCDNAGVNIKWMLDNLDSLNGSEAKFVVKLGWMYGGKVYVSTGTVCGRICSKKEGEGFGFDPYFIPDGSEVPYSVEKPDHLNPRYIALKNFINGKVTVYDPIKNWNGEFQ